MICNFYLSVAARPTCLSRSVTEDILACCWDVKHPTNKQTAVIIPGSDLITGFPEVTLPDAWRCGVSASNWLSSLVTEYCDWARQRVQSKSVRFHVCASEQNNGNNDIKLLMSYYHTIPHKLCGCEVKDVHSLQSFASTHSEERDSVLFILCLQ